MTDTEIRQDQLAAAAAANRGDGIPSGLAEFNARFGPPRRFPQPVAELEMGNVWAWPDVEKWARKTGRL